MSKERNTSALSDLETYWSKRYVDQCTGWDLGGISEPIRCYIDQVKNKYLKVLVPGAGNGYEAEYLYRSGFKNTFIVDISEIPLENFKQRIPEFPDNQIIHADFFELEDQFDLIIEQTFFCSFPPKDNFREKYTEHMHKLLNPNGKLSGLWFNFPFSGDFTKRPFGCTKQEYEKLFQSYFKLNTFEPCYNSVPDRIGKELFGILQKK